MSSQLFISTASKKGVLFVSQSLRKNFPGISRSQPRTPGPPHHPSKQLYPWRQSWWIHTSSPPRGVDVNKLTAGPLKKWLGFGVWRHFRLVANYVGFFGVSNSKTVYDVTWRLFKSKGSPQYQSKSAHWIQCFFLGRKTWFHSSDVSTRPGDYLLLMVASTCMSTHGTLSK